MLGGVSDQVGVAACHVISLAPANRGDGGDSQQGVETMLPSTSATLIVVLTTHLSEGLVRVVHDECHGVAVALWQGTASAISNLLKKKTPEIPCEKGRVGNKERTPARCCVD